MDINGILGILGLLTPPIAAIIIKIKKPDLYKKLGGSFWIITIVGLALFGALVGGIQWLIEFFDGTDKIRDEKLFDVKTSILKGLSYVVYAICILFHRFYMRYVFYSLYLFISASGTAMEVFYTKVKDKGYNGHSLRVAKWDFFKGKDDSQISYLIWTTINPFIFGLLYLALFYGIYIMIFGS